MRNATSSTGTLLRGSGVLMAQLGIIGVTGFVSWVLLANRLPMGVVGDGSGLVVLTSLVTYATTLGLPVAVSRFARDDDAASRAVMTWSLLLTILSSALGALAVVALTSTGILPTPGGFFGWPEGLVMFAGAAATSVIVLIDYRQLSLGRERQVLVRTVLIASARLLTVALLPATSSVVMVWMATVLPTAVVVAVLTPWWIRDCPLRTFKPLPSHRLRRFTIANAFSLLLVQAPSVAFPAVVVGWLGSTERAIFYVVWTFVALLFMVPQLTGRVLLSSAKGTNDEMRGHAWRSLQITLAVGVLALVGSLVLAFAIPWFYGESYRPARAPLVVFVAALIPYAVTSTALNDARARERNRVTVVLSVVLAAVVLIPAPLLASRHGVMGAALVWLFAHTIAAILALTLVGDVRRSLASIRVVGPTYALCAAAAVVAPALMLGWTGVLVSLAVAAARVAGLNRVVIWLSVLLMATAAVATLVEGDLVVGLGYATQRPWASATAGMSIALAVSWALWELASSRAVRTSDEFDVLGPPSTAGGTVRRGPVCWLITAVAMVVVLVSAPTSYMVDARFDLSWAPSRVLRRLGSIWQETGGIGRVGGSEYNPVLVPLYAALRAIGFSPALTEHLVHGGLLAVGGIGAAALLATYMPRWGWPHAVAGLVYMVHPVSLNLFSNSLLFIGAVVSAPWLLLAVVRSARERPTWRWAAVATLAIAIPAPTEQVSVVFNVGIASICALLLVALGGRSVARALGTFALRTALLVSAALAFVGQRVLAGRGDLLQRLALTEPPELVNSVSSYAETARGMGNWLAYFRFGSTQPRAHLEPLVTSPLVVLATFALPIVGLIFVARSSWRYRVVFVVLFGAAAMVGVGVYAQPSSWWGAVVSWAYETVPAAEAFRNTSKVAGMLALSTAILFAFAMWSVAQQIARVQLRVLAAVGAGAVVVAASVPVWTGNVYSSSRQLSGVPSYWREATEWIDDNNLGIAGRVMVLPGSSSTRYRWGAVGDDIFSALLSSPYVRTSSFAQSTPMSESVLAALTAAAGTPRLGPSGIADVLRRFGIRYVIVRNDLVWEGARQPRPSSYGSIRSSDEFVLKARFGRPGEYTTDVADESPEASVERGLPPVEVYEVRDWQPIVRVVPAVAPLVVSGDGAAWVSLAENDMLAGARPTVFSAAAGSDELASMFESGSPLMVTDTNVRRVRSSTATATVQSSALQESVVVDGAGSLFSSSGSQTTSSISGIESVSSSVPSVSQPWYRPEQLLDGNPRTTWRTPGLSSPVGQWVRFDLDEPVPVRGVRVTMPSSEGNTVTIGSVETSTGEVLRFVPLGGVAEVEFDGRPLEWIRVRIDAVAGSGPVVLSDVLIDGTPRPEYRRVPFDVIVRANDDQRLAAALLAAPVGFAFEREIGDGPVPVELQLRRRFATVSSAAYAVSAVMGEDPAGGPGPESDDVCADRGLRVDGVSVLLRVADRLADGRVVVEACEPLLLPAGDHFLDHAAGADRLVLLPDGLAGADLEVPFDPRSVAVSPLEGGRMALRVRSIAGQEAASGPVVVTTGRGYHSGWSIGGARSPVSTVDTQTAVTVVPDSTVTMEFGPQRLYRLLFALMIVAVGACVMLAMQPWRWRRGSWLRDVLRRED